MASGVVVALLNTTNNRYYSRISALSARMHALWARISTLSALRQKPSNVRTVVVNLTVHWVRTDAQKAALG
jgi:hypothetical protein